MAAFLRYIHPATDLYEIASLDRKIFRPHFSLVQLRTLICATSHVGGYVACDENFEIRGYVLYSLQSSSIEVLRIGVHADNRRQAIGTCLIADLKERAFRRQSGDALTAMVPDSLLGAHLFLKACGFVAAHVHRSYYRGEDYYEFHLLNAGGLDRARSITEERRGNCDRGGRDASADPRR